MVETKLIWLAVFIACVYVIYQELSPYGKPYLSQVAKGLWE